MYGITNERVIMISGLFSRQTKSFNLRGLTDITLTEHSNGLGTITFGQSYLFSGIYQGMAWPGGGRFTLPSFELLHNAREVYDHLRKAQREATQGDNLRKL